MDLAFVGRTAPSFGSVCRPAWRPSSGARLAEVIEGNAALEAALARIDVAAALFVQSLPAAEKKANYARARSRSLRPPTACGRCSGRRPGRCSGSRTCSVSCSTGSCRSSSRVAHFCATRWGSPRRTVHRRRSGPSSSPSSAPSIRRARPRPRLPPDRTSSSRGDGSRRSSAAMPFRTSSASSTTSLERVPDAPDHAVLIPGFRSRSSRGLTCCVRSTSSPPGSR